MRNVDVLYFILRAFESPDVSSYDERIDPVADLQIIQQELMLHVCYVAILRPT